MAAHKLPPDGNVTLEQAAPSRQRLLQLYPPQVYIIGLVVLAVVLLVPLLARALAKRSRPSVSSPAARFAARQPDCSKDSQSYGGEPYSPAPLQPTSHPGHSPQPFACYDPPEKQVQSVWSPGLLPTPARTPWSALGATPEMGTHPQSRGVSNPPADLRSQLHPPFRAPSELSAPANRNAPLPPPPFTDRPAPRIDSASPDGTLEGEEDKSKGAMEGDSWPAQQPRSAGLMGPDPATTAEPHHVDGSAPAFVSAAGSSSSSSSSSAAQHFPGYSSTPRQFPRPPPPPPLTPPTLSAGAFTFEDRRPNYAASIPPLLDTTFIHQPNPDYTASSPDEFASGGGATPTSNATASPATPRRRSYTKTVPVGIPIPPAGPSSSPRPQDPSSSPLTEDTFYSSSYPPSSPRLPPPPPGHFDDAKSPTSEDSEAQEIDLQGEIISVTDGAGHGWKRHTRVYGGGVCLACLASGGQGGFYGDRVPPEDRR